MTLVKTCVLTSEAAPKAADAPLTSTQPLCECVPVEPQVCVGRHVDQSVPGTCQPPQRLPQDRPHAHDQDRDAVVPQLLDRDNCVLRPPPTCEHHHSLGDTRPGAPLDSHHLVIDVQQGCAG